MKNLLSTLFILSGLAIGSVSFANTDHKFSNEATKKEYIIDCYQNSRQSLDNLNLDADDVIGLEAIGRDNYVKGINLIEYSGRLKGSIDLIKKMIGEACKSKADTLDNYYRANIK